MLTNDNKIAF